MKDYEHVVIWLDYFNKTLPRNKGRRLSKEKCVFDPSLKELIDASNAAGLQPNETEEQVRFPKRPYVRSGYIEVFPFFLLVEHYPGFLLKHYLPELFHQP